MLGLAIGRGARAMTHQMQTTIPIPALKSIYTILLEGFYVEVPYSDDPLEMAQAAIDRQKKSISQALDILHKHCPLVLDPEKEPEP